MRNLTAIAATTKPETASLTLLGKAVLLGGGDPETARQIAEKLAMPEVVKAAVAPIFTTDNTSASGLNATRTILTTFAPLLRSTSVFFRAFFDVGMIRAPLRRRISFMSSAISFGIVNQSEVVKVQRATFDSVALEPVKTAGIVVFSDEFLAFLSEGGEALLALELRRAIAAAVDAAFFTVITDVNTPNTTSNGSTEVDAYGDVWWLLENVELTAESKPLLVAAPDVARRAATLVGGGGRAFPNMSPTGGEMAGIPVVVSDGVAAGRLGLIDCAGIAGEVQGIEIKSSRHATIQLDDSPDSPATVSTTMINLWSRNLTGLQPEVYFAAQRLRDSAFAYVSAVQWNGSGNSPA